MLMGAYADGEQGHPSVWAEIIYINNESKALPSSFNVSFMFLVKLVNKYNSLYIFCQTATEPNINVTLF